MSWDIFVQDLPKEAATVADIPDDFKPAPLGSRSEIIKKILEVVPAANFSDPAWGTIAGGDWSIEVNIGPDEECRGFAFHVRGGDEAVGTVAAILDHLKLRAIDAQAGNFFSAGPQSLASVEKWQAYRNRVVRDGG